MDGTERQVKGGGVVVRHRRLVLGYQTVKPAHVTCKNHAPEPIWGKSSEPISYIKVMMAMMTMVTTMMMMVAEMFIRIPVIIINILLLSLLSSLWSQIVCACVRVCGWVRVWAG